MSNPKHRLKFRLSNPSQKQLIIVVYSGCVLNGVSLTILSAKLKSPQVKQSQTCIHNATEK